MCIAEDDERSVSLREQQKAETRARVVAAARALFGTVGYEAATIREIARRAGVAPGSVFTTFASKTELLQEIIFTRYQEMLPDVRAAAAGGGDVRERLARAAAKAYEYELRELRLVAETIGASYRWSQAEEEENRRRLAPIYGLMLETMIAARAEGALRAGLAPELVVELAFSCYLRNFRRALFDGWDADALANHFRAQLDAIFDGAAA